MKLLVKKLFPDALVPLRAHEGDAGVDLFSYENRVLAPGERALISTGISVAVPDGFVFLIKDRSGLAAKHGLTTLAGVVDSGYRGEVKVVLLNTGSKPYSISKGDRIAQALVLPVPDFVVEEVDDLDSSSRGEGGFGSTGY